MFKIGMCIMVHSCAPRNYETDTSIQHRRLSGGTYSTPFNEISLDGAFEIFRPAFITGVKLSLFRTRYSQYRLSLPSPRAQRLNSSGRSRVAECLPARSPS